MAKINISLEIDEGYSSRLMAEILYNNDRIQYRHIDMYFGFSYKKKSEYYITLLAPSPVNETGFIVLANSFFGNELMVDECFENGNEAIDFIANFLDRYKWKVLRKRKPLFYIDIDDFNFSLGNYGG